MSEHAFDNPLPGAISSAGALIEDRRRRGVCVDCGLDTPKPDPKTGRPRLRCGGCEFNHEQREKAKRNGGRR